MSSLGMIGRANGKNNNRYAPLSDDSTKPDEVSNGTNVGVTARVAGKLIEIPTAIERDGEVYTVVPYKKTKLANVAQMERACSLDHGTRNASWCGVDMRDAGQAAPFDTARGDDGKMDPKLAIDHRTEAALSKCKAMETQTKQEL